MRRLSITNNPQHVLTALLSLLPVVPHNSTHALTNTPTPTPNHNSPKTAIIIGAGPAGLATALSLLSNNNIPTSPKFTEITILESLPENTSYEPSRAYFYNINRRGQSFTDRFDIKLSDGGLGVTSFARQTVPADPRKVFDGSQPFSREMSAEEREEMGTLYWIPRHELVRLLTERLERENGGNGRARVRVVLGAGCDRVEPCHDGRVRVVTTATQAGGGAGGEEALPSALTADLVVGADGVSSAVRRSLAEGRFRRWKGGSARNFRLRKWKTPSTGLRIKGLLLSPDFAIPRGDGSGETVPIERKYNYALKSATNGPRDRLTLTILPQKDVSAGRSVNICALPDHDLWRMEDGDQLREYFTRAFPRFDWDALVEKGEWDRFVRAEGGRFPLCQYSPRLHVSKDGGGGVVLVGDALHAFPPDLGQGVNSALCDVLTLGDCLYPKHSNDHDPPDSSVVTISTALSQYERINAPETRSLVALARCGAPYQYEQSSFRMRVGRILWTLNLAFRLLLHKVTGGFSPKPAIMRMMNPNMSFRRVMRRADVLTAVLGGLVGTGLVVLVRMMVMVRLVR